jgi:hypothetical protein
VIVYALACRRPQFTDPIGMGALRTLYAHLGVPLEGLNIALSQLKILSQHEVVSPTEARLLNESFDHLLAELNKSAVKT